MQNGNAVFLVEAPVFLCGISVPIRIFSKNFQRHQKQIFAFTGLFQLSYTFGSQHVKWKDCIFDGGAVLYFFSVSL